MTVGPGKESELLALLLVNANQPVSTDILIEDIWEERQPANAAKTVQIYVSRLRGWLGARRLSDDPRPATCSRRARQSSTRVASSGLRPRTGVVLEAGNALERRSSCRQGLDFWRGEAPTDFRFDAFAQAEIRRLQELRASGSPT